MPNCRIYKNKSSISSVFKENILNEPSQKLKIKFTWKGSSSSQWKLVQVALHNEVVTNSF